MGSEHKFLSQSDLEKRLDLYIKLNFKKTFRNHSGRTWKCFGDWCKKEELTRCLTEFCEIVIWKCKGWQDIVSKGMSKIFCWEMFHFSKLIKISAKEIFAVWSGSAKSFSRRTERWQLLSAQRICLYTKGRTFLPELLDQCPPTAFLQYLSSHNFGKTA